MQFSSRLSSMDSSALTWHYLLSLKECSTLVVSDESSFKGTRMSATATLNVGFCLAWIDLLAVDLDVAARYEPSVTVGQIRSGDADEKRVLARTRISIIAGVYSVLVAQLLIHLGIAFEGCAVAGEGHRRHAGVRAVHVDAPTRSAIIVIGKRRIGLIIHRDKPEIGEETMRLGRDLAAPGDLLCSWRRWWRGARASARRDDGACCRCELVREVCPDQPARPRVVVSGVASNRDRRELVVVGEGNIGEVAWVERDLEQVGQAAVGVPAQAPR